MLPVYIVKFRPDAKFEITVKDIYRGKDSPPQITALEQTVGIDKVKTLDYLQLYWNIHPESMPALFNQKQ